MGEPEKGCRPTIFPIPPVRPVDFGIFSQLPKGKEGEEGFFVCPSPFPSPKRLWHNRKPRGEAVGFQSFRMRVFYIMGNRRLYKIECFRMACTPESERLEVTALNLFHPTTSPPCAKVSLFVLRHNLLRERS